VIRVLADALTTPAMLVERLGTAGIPSDQVRKMLDRATRLAAALNRSPVSARVGSSEVYEPIKASKRWRACSSVSSGPLLAV
jgi:hypothetical protein